jgi:uncharacterized tellurite resistance protein B-like protein
MDEAFRLTKKAFIIIIISFAIATLFLKVAMPDMNPMLEFLSAIFSNPFAARAVIFVGFFVVMLFVLLMPLSAFFAYWCSMVFACYYFISHPLEASFLFVVLGSICLLNRFHVIGFFEPQVNIAIAFVSIVVFGIFVGIFEISLVEYPAVKLLLLMPAFHILGMRPGDGSKSQFQADAVQVGSGVSSVGKAKMAGISDVGWWEFIRPHLEAVPYKIIALFDNFSNIKIYGSKEKTLPRSKTLKQSQNLESNLSKLKSRDSGFNQTEFLKRARKAFSSVQKAFYQHEIEKVQAFISDALFEQFQCRVREQQEAGINFHCDEISQIELSIDHVFFDNSFDEIQVLFIANARESMKDINTGETIETAKNRKIHEYWSFIRRPSARTLAKPGLIEGSCPNCGAPLVLGQSTRCNACESYIRSGYYDWVLAKITQACEWSYSDPSVVPSWDLLKKRDEQFTIHQIEDLAAVIFWNLRLAERKRDPNAALRFAASDFAESLARALEQKNSRFHNYWENIAIASVSLRGIVCKEDKDHLYVLVVWSGIPVKIGADGKMTERIRYNRPVRDVLVLCRDAKVKTNQNNTLSSSHCPGCGAPLASSFALHCGYCGATLNSGKEWQLENLLKENDPVYVEILNKKAEIVSENYNRLAKSTVAKKEQEVLKEEIRSGRDIITVMVQVLLADGKIDDTELAFVKAMAKKYHMPEEALQGIFETTKTDSEFMPRPANLREAQDILKGAAEMAYADSVLSPQEEETLQKVASKLGYSAMDLKRILRNAQKAVYKKR